MTKTIAIINQKGGVGKTACAINISYALSISGQKTLFIDLDPSANATSTFCAGIDIMPRHSSCSLFSEENIIDTCFYYVKECNNLKILPSHIKLALVQRQLVSRTYREKIIENSLVSIRKNFDLIIMDCCPTLGDLTINAIYAADYLIFPITYEKDALEGLADLFIVINEVKHGQNYKFKILRNRKDLRKSLATEFVDANLSAFIKDERVFQTIIHQDENINQAKIHNKTIFEFDKKSKGAKDFTKLTQEVTEWLR